ncbi:MAG: hypothetical protein DYG98_26265 [Haliscomenobacteraceae bacterium CHB4]|nr:hypothetical protein [Saprospiraceae bacterium]MCE7926566.1 hypothetical protein [Haliscomenobacteraceae bacterium CHB4]
MQEEFYIGWQTEAPPSFARVVRRSVTGLCVLVPLTAILITYFQTGFSNGTFEFGKKTELEGIFSENPFPFLTIESGKDATGNPVFQKILLVGKGKFGFQKAEGGGWRVEGEPAFAEAMAGKGVKVSGFLIYNDGKTAMEVESIEIQEEAKEFEKPSTVYRPPSTVHRLPSAVQLRGEITDPKCLLGVMNPGQGKPHRDCAVRCLAGGIAPMLKVTGASGETEYYLLAGANGEALNDRLLEYAGDGVQICGRLEQQDDWWVLYADPATIRRVNKGTLNVGVMCN